MTTNTVDDDYLAKRQLKKGTAALAAYNRYCVVKSALAPPSP